MAKHFDMITTAALLSETVALMYETTRRHITEGRCVGNYRLENSKIGYCREGVTRGCRKVPDEKVHNLY